MREEGLCVRVDEKVGEAVQEHEQYLNPPAADKQQQTTPRDYNTTTTVCTGGCQVQGSFVCSFVGMMVYTLSVPVDCLNGSSIGRKHPSNSPLSSCSCGGILCASHPGITVLLSQ